MGWPWPVITYWTASASIDNSTSRQCSDETSLGLNLRIASYAFAAATIVILNLLQPVKKNCRTFLSSIVVPINLLSSTPFRVIYCLILSCWAADVLDDLTNSSLYFHSRNGLMDAMGVFFVTPSVVILRQAVLYFPVLACVDAPIPVLAHTLGLLHILLLVVSNGHKEAVVFHGCSYQGPLDNKDIVIEALIKFPVFIFYLLIALWYFCRASIEVVLVLFANYRLIQKIHDLEVFRVHVSNLLKPRWKSNSSNAKCGKFCGSQWRNLWQYWTEGLKFILPYNKDFRYPLPFLGALSMSWMVLYQLAVRCSAYVTIAAQDLAKFVDSFNITVQTAEKLIPNSRESLEMVFEDLQRFSLALTIILPFGIVAAFIVCIPLTVYMVQSYHKNLAKATNGNLGFLLRSEPLQSASYILAATMRYSAFQMAYVIFCWIVYTLIAYVWMTLGLIFYFMFKESTHLGITMWSWIMIPFFWSAFLHLFQLFLNRYIFLDTESYHQRFISIRYQKLYHLMTYLLLFFNVILGVVSCFLRIFGVFTFSSIMLFRIDWDVFMRGLEGWDLGHRTYIGHVYMELTYNNAVLRTFVQLLQETVVVKTITGTNEKTPLLGSYSATTHNYKSIKKYKMQGRCSRAVLSLQARNRWLVAYTLLNNPSLLCTRAPWKK